MLRAGFLIANLSLYVILASAVGKGAMPPYQPPPPPPPSSFSVPPSTPAQPPTEVGRSGEVKTCPPEYEMLGKECVKVVTIPATPQCGANGEMTPEGVCAVFFGKTAQCPEGYERLGEKCEHRETGSPFSVCDSGYTLTDMDECVAPIEQEPQESRSYRTYGHG